MNYVSSAQSVSLPAGRTDITVFIELIVVIRSSRLYAVSSKLAQNFRPQDIPPCIGLSVNVRRKGLDASDANLLRRERSAHNERHETCLMPPEVARQNRIFLIWRINSTALSRRVFAEICFGIPTARSHRRLRKSREKESGSCIRRQGCPLASNRGRTTRDLSSRGRFHARDRPTDGRTLTPGRTIARPLLRFCE